MGTVQKEVPHKCYHGKTGRSPFEESRGNTRASKFFES